jgi:hypothetical protein
VVHTASDETASGGRLTVADLGALHFFLGVRSNTEYE